MPCLPPLPPLRRFPRMALVALVDNSAPVFGVVAVVGADPVALAVNSVPAVVVILARADHKAVPVAPDPTPALIARLLRPPPRLRRPPPHRLPPPRTNHRVRVFRGSQSRTLGVG
jgi:hypothetical protein